MPGLKLMERVHRLTERLDVLLSRHLLGLRLRLLRKPLVGLGDLAVSVGLKAQQGAVIGLRRALVQHHRGPIVTIPPEVLVLAPKLGARALPERDVSVRVGKLAAQIIELRLQFSDSPLQSGVFDDPGVKELRELLARELGALQERQQQ